MMRLLLWDILNQLWVEFGTILGTVLVNRLDTAKVVFRKLYNTKRARRPKLHNTETERKGEKRPDSSTGEYSTSARLKDPSRPYSLGARSSKLDETISIPWNRQVQHVLASSSSTGYTIVWDLRNKRRLGVWWSRLDWHHWWWW